jgi:hypothetical protein
VTERVIRGGAFRETFTNSGQPTKDNSKNPHPRLKSGQYRVFVKFDISGIRKQTLLPSTVSVRVKGSLSAQTWTITPVAERMTMREVNHDNLPDLITGDSWTVSVPARTDGQWVDIDVTDYLQTIADGAKNYGLQITTNSGAVNTLYGTESRYKNDAWKLTYDIVEKPDPPTALSPNGGFIDSPAPVVSSAFRDPGGASKVLAALRVEVGTVSGSTFTPTWDSGEVSTTRPRLNLATTYGTGGTGGLYPGAVEGTTPKWRMWHMDGSGEWSEVSDVAEWTYDPKVEIELVNPLAGVVFDCTPTFAFELTGGVAKAWRLHIYEPNEMGRELYDSRKQPGNDATTVAHEIPFRDKEHRRRILKDDQTYWGRLKVWDRLDREALPGEPPYAELTFEFTVDDDVELTPPDDLIAHQIGDTPRVRLTWPIPGGYAEGYTITRGGERIERLDPDDVEIDEDALLASWVDDSAPPNVESIYTVQAVYDGAQTTKSPEAAVTPVVEGVWLLGDGVEAVLRGLQVDGFEASDKQVTHELLNTPFDVDIIYALRGVVGSFTGQFSDEPDHPWQDTYAALMAMRQAPDAEIRMVYATLNVPVTASIGQPMPHVEFNTRNMLHRVSFTAKQSDDFTVMR